MKGITPNKEDTGLRFLIFWRQPDWGFYNRRNEAFARELAKRHGVDCVIHVEWLALRGLFGILLRYFRTRDKALKAVYRLHFTKAISRRPVPLADKLFVYTVLTLSYYEPAHFRFVDRWLTGLQLGIIDRNLSSKSSKRRIMLVYPPHPRGRELIESIRYDVLMVDLVDDLAALSDDSDRQSIETLYADVLPACSVAFTTSTHLSNKYRARYSCEFEFLANGVSLGSLDKSVGQGDLDYGRKSIGYVGILNRELDLELIDHVLRDNPEVTFYFVGAIESNLDPRFGQLVKECHNLHYLGQKTHEEIRMYLNSFGVLANFKKADFTTWGNDSIKIYEYLATGKPIVSTSMAPANRFPELIYVADDMHTFSELLKIAICEDIPTTRERRIRIARQHTWERRVDIIMSRTLRSLHQKARREYQ